MVPSSLSVSTLCWYNAKLFREHALKSPKSWEELLDAFGKLRAAGIGPIGLGNSERWPLGNWLTIAHT